MCDNMPISLRTLCLVTLVLCNITDSLEHEIPRRSFLSRRAIDGTRGRKYFDPEEEGAFDSYGSAGGQYDPYEEKTDLSDIRRNVPGEPGVDYPAYTTLPQTGFTCEGRSRGYYADEVAGCQVFHVCHDVLVSSFLCPIGSTFSQKLLTCDWWTKVDCSSSGKYIDVNRNSYQQDDDEMIRNAYAMISLQSGTDVTKDGLVDPDRTGSVVDYQRGLGRVQDYSMLDPTGNDLRSNFDEYSGPVSRDFLPPYRSKDRDHETDRSYQERYYPTGKPRSPYQDSPIIRVQNIKDPLYRHQDRYKDHEEGYRGPNEFTNQFQPSYAPTVPTVTTTTRRYYSPTVPTTFRPSTVAYNKLDQVIDRSDYYFSRSRTNSFVTPPTRSSENDQNSQGLREVVGKPVVPPRKEDDYEDDYEDANHEEGRDIPSGERFQVRVAEDFRVNRTGLSNLGLLFDQMYRRFEQIGQSEDGLDDIETRDSIGLGHALSQSFRGIAVQQQNPVNDGVKDDEKSEIDYQQTASRSGPTTLSDDRDEETTEQYQRDDGKVKEMSLDHQDTEKQDFVPSTSSPVVESTIKATTSVHESDSVKSLQSSSQKNSLGRIDTYLRPPEESSNKFQINVPDFTKPPTFLIRYSTLNDDTRPETSTTELPGFQTTYSNSHIDHPTTYDGDTSFPNRQATDNKPLLPHTGSSLPPISPHQLESKVPLSNVLASNEHRLDSFSISNKTEKRIESYSNSGLKPIINGADTDRDLKETGTGHGTTSGSNFPKMIETTVSVHSSKNPTEVNIPTTTSSFAKLPINESPQSTSNPVTSRGFKDSKSSAVSDKQLEITKSIESEIDITHPPSTTVNTLNLDDRFNVGNNLSDAERKDSEYRNFNTVSLLQLMFELLKLDRVPRPFSLSDTHGSKLSPPEIITSSTIPEITAKQKVQFQGKIVDEGVESFTESLVKTRVHGLKDHILDRLAENFGEPLFKNLPQRDKSVDLRSDLPLQESANVSISTGTDAASSSSRVHSRATTIITTTTTTTPQTTLATNSERTVVKTELVPSIGFALDTDMGREEYVEAVLGGLIEPVAAESENKETVLKETAREASLTRNETLTNA